MVGRFLVFDLHKNIYLKVDILMKCAWWDRTYRSHETNVEARVCSMARQINKNIISAFSTIRLNSSRRFEKQLYLLRKDYKVPNVLHWRLQKFVPFEHNPINVNQKIPMPSLPISYAVTDPT